MVTGQVPLGRGLVRPAGSPTGVMGILNVTPDSFSDGGALRSVEEVVDAARRMRRAGACILDVGGESTRPGAEDVPVDEEVRRTAPVVRALVQRVGLPVSIDTRKAAVFEAAWHAGAAMLNDVAALAHDPELGPAVARTDAAVVLMHGRGDPRTMDGLARYGDVVGEVAGELASALRRAERAGIEPARVILDPGIGFAKDAEQNWELLRRVDDLRALGRPLLVGPSRKRFLGGLTGHEDPADRDVATAVVVGHLAARRVELVRVHAVSAAADAIRIAGALAGTPARQETAP